MAKKIVEFTIASGLGCGMPPVQNFVIIYFLQQRQTVAEANCFFNFYSSRNWSNAKGKGMKNWKTAASEWIWNKQHPKKKKDRQKLAAS